MQANWHSPQVGLLSVEILTTLWLSLSPTFESYSTSRRNWAQNARVKRACVSNTHASASLTRAQTKVISSYELAYCSPIVVILLLVLIAVCHHVSPDTAELHYTVCCMLTPSKPNDKNSKLTHDVSRVLIKTTWQQFARPIFTSVALKY